MKKSSTVLACSLMAVLAACDARSEGDASSADDFAARINGGAQGGAASEAADAPSVAAPLPVAGNSSDVPGTMADPASSICGANLMEPYIGQKYDDAVRVQIVETAANNEGGVRFVLPGTATVQPDPTSPRLSIMIDNLGVIRDARCG
ncbi:I78 family peptidase inhibitor [uncultured Erythrobacter sp.]|uniref:I78 family peptidase inhibitor n=1 Tax=uncultured Erythrobacter sp. TaxID=263913 RepID=UPI002616A8EC|nr:I78 family peptidase inhibitor [uncultured Erythrobacter sp.]